MPLVETKKALMGSKPDEAIKILIDNEVSKNNVLKFLEDNGVHAGVSIRGNTYELLLNPAEATALSEEKPLEEYCRPEDGAAKDYVVVFARDRIGDGTEELGKMLVGGFLETFMALDRLPEKIIFINSGIFLILKGSPYLAALKNLEDKGVKLMACGTCMEHYGQVKEMALGEISNAYDILSALTGAGKVLNL